MRNRLVWLLLFLWALAFAWSLIACWRAPMDGDGFTRGLNRLMTFFGWQVVAGAAGGMAFILGLHLPLRSDARRWSAAPVAAAIMLVIGLAALVSLVLLGAI